MWSKFRMYLNPNMADNEYIPIKKRPTTTQSHEAKDISLGCAIWSPLKNNRTTVKRRE